MMITLPYRRLFTSSSEPSSPKAEMSPVTHCFDRYVRLVLAHRDLSSRGRIAVCVDLYLVWQSRRPSSSTMKISDGSRDAQSASLPGRTVDVSKVFRRTMSRAALAAAAAACAELALL
jgi:hypothetical protein